MLEIIDHPLFIPSYRGLDASLYHNLAFEILKNGVFVDRIFLLIYPLILSGIYFITSSNIFVAKLIQIFIGSLSCVLVFFITKNIFNKKSARIAAVMSVFYPVTIIHESMLIYVSYVIFLNLLSILLLVSKKTSYLKIFTSGFLLTISFLISPKNIFFIISIFIFIGFYFKEKYNSQKTFLFMGVFGLGILLVFLPIFYAAMLSEGPLLSTTPYAVTSFYIGNNLSADGIFKPISGIRYSIKGQIEDFRTIAEAELNRKLSPIQISLYWIKKGLDFIKQNPLKYINLELKKIALFFNYKEYSDLIQNINYFKKYSSLIKFLSLFSFGIVCPLGMMGMLLGYNKNIGSKLLIIYILSYLLILMIFYVTSRYRLPAIYAFFCFAGYFINWLYINIKTAEWKKITYACVGLLMFSFGVNANINVDSPEKISHYNQGVIYSIDEKFDKALVEYKKALKENTNDVNVHFGIGEVYFKKKKYGLAAQKFRTCLKLKPTFFDAYYNLGLSLFKLEEYNLASKYLIRLLEFNFNDMHTHFLLAKVWLKLGECNKALKEFQIVLRQDITHKNRVKHEIEVLKKQKCKIKVSDIENIVN